MHAVCTFPAKRKYTVHLEVKWGGKLICNIVATILKVLQIQSSVGESGITYLCGNLSHTLWHALQLDIISRLSGEKCSTWFRSIRFLVSSPDPTQEEKFWWRLANRLGFINIDYFLGRIFHPPITLQKTPFVVANLETLVYFSTMTAIFLVLKKKKSYQFSTASYEFW